MLKPYIQFQLTRPVKDATSATRRARRSAKFQLTRPAKDATDDFVNFMKRLRFNSRVPRRTRRFLRGFFPKNLRFQLTRPAKDATVYQESTDMITLSGRVCATVRGGVGSMGLCGAEARELTGAVRCADIWGFLCELGVRASVLHKRRRLAAASLRRFYMT